MCQYEKGFVKHNTAKHVQRSQILSEEDKIDRADIVIELKRKFGEVLQVKIILEKKYSAVKCFFIAELISH